MTAAQLVGAAMLAALFIGLFAAICVEEGPRIAALILLATIVTTAVIIFAILLLTGVVR